MKVSKKQALAVLLLLTGILQLSCSESFIKTNKNYHATRHHVVKTYHAGEKIWRYKTGGMVESSPAFMDRRVYVGSWDKNLYCFDAKSGKRLWRYKTGDKILSSPTVVDGRVYVGSYDHYLYCLDAKSGKMLWRYKTGGEVFSSTTVVDGKVYVGSYDHYLYCFDAKSGRRLWRYKTGDKVGSSPTVVDGRVYVGSLNHYLYCLDAKSGKMLWHYKTGDVVFSSPTVVDGRVYVGSDNHYLYCFDAKSGRRLWRYKTGDEVGSSPVVVDGRVYVGSDNHYIYCIDAKSGKRLWRYKTGDAVSSSPTVVDGRLYVGSYDHYLYCLDAKSGKRLWRYKTGDAVFSSPIIVNGRVYVGNDDGYLYCLGAGSAYNQVAYPAISGMDNISHAVKPKLPPLLALKASVDVGYDKLLKALESGKITLTVKNTGKGNAYSLEVMIKRLSGTSGISYDPPEKFSVMAGSSKTITLNIKASKKVRSGMARFKVYVKEPYFGMDTDPVLVEIQTVELFKPKFVLSESKIDDSKRGNGNGIPEPGEMVNFTLRIVNTGKGEGQAVTVVPRVIGDRFVSYVGNPVLHLGDLKPGGYYDAVIPVVIGKRISKKEAQITLDLKEARSYGNDTFVYNFKVGEKPKEQIETIVVKDDKWKAPSPSDVKIAPLSVDVDKNIPKGRFPYKKIVAVIIGNKDYQNGIPSVDFALNDARTVKNYLLEGFGVKKYDLIYAENASLSTVMTIFGSKDDYTMSKLYRLCLREKPDMIFVYYSGHGIPGIKDKRGYLAPVNVDKQAAEITGYSLDLFYANLNKMKKTLGIKQLVVALDSCFSGDSAEGMLIKGIAPITAVVDNPLVASKSGTVFLATSGKEYASFYKEKQHGMFTYFWLKGISGAADTNKDKKITLREMRTYLDSTVPRWSQVEIGITQKPQVNGKDLNQVIAYLR